MREKFTAIGIVAGHGLNGSSQVNNVYQRGYQVALRD